MRAVAGPARVIRMVASPLARSTGWALGAEVAKLFTSVGTFLVVTHLLAPGDYGVYVGTLGMLWFILPFASFGASYLVLQRVAGEGVPVLEAVGRANGMVIAGGGAATALIVAVRPWLLPQSPALVLALLAVAELVGGGLLEVSVFACQADERLRLSMWLRLLQGLTRFVAAIGLVVLYPTAGLTAWAWVHCATAMASAAVAQVFFRGDGPLPVRRPRWAEVRLGLPYSVGFGADKLRESADAMLLLRVGSSIDAGIYGAATRLINVALVPLRALIASSNARFFAAGARSVDAAASVTRQVTAMGGAYAVTAALGVVVAGPAVISFLSDDYATAGDALRLLSVLPLAVTAEAFVATAMTAIGHQRIRVVSIMASTGVNVVLNVLLIPAYGWRGAVVASLACSAVNAAVLWSTLALFRARERRGR